jgi:pimeloyl-ACP methyl ester carboxylesterase
VARPFARLAGRTGSDLTEAWRGFTSLGDADSRRAFLATTRSVLDPGGQTATAHDHLPVSRPPATLIIWGTRDRMIPTWHATTAQQAIPGSRVELFEGAGHFPYLDHPERFADLLVDFIAEPLPNGAEDDE